ncbi:HAD-IIIC family phosphatase [Micromonospora eburnea]|uniref:Methoxymalonate biosynthesis protein n=1 Tax=Micromonospora eburnea TaxID=227316 RepID=A0A1C6UIV9_9ACTN|nr:HAD-IIIC family phosphatase [Micromonospora eburnea]SCL53894.1 methoxymalonate biosynthesis protein [Micromonospora eburnea]
MSDTTLVKCLVWDLDNTLWQGTLLEGDSTPVSDEVRAVVDQLDARGILQSVASKNDPEPATARLVELGMADYLVLPQIGWGPKSEAVRRIADRLGFAHNTIAFIDDQPAERAEVAFHLPDVRCYSSDQAVALLDLPEFTPRTVTVDSRRRRHMYQAGLQRETAQSAFQGTSEEFLRSLELRMTIQRAEEAELARVEELTLRTSQMNATGVHYSRAALRELIGSSDHEVLVATLTDRFGPHGAIGVVMLEVRPDRWHLKLLATSCRVVSFGAGTAILGWVIDQAARAGAHLVADFRPTDRNRLMEVTYRFAGLTDDPCACLAGCPTTDGIQRLHVVAARRPAPAALRLDAVDLVADHVVQPPAPRSERPLANQRDAVGHAEHRDVHPAVAVEESVEFPHRHGVRVPRV